MWYGLPMRMFLLALALLLPACTGRSSPADDTGTPPDTDGGGSDTSADTSSDTGPVDVPADNVSTALGDCAGYYTEPPEYPNQLFSGDELQRYTLGDSNAVCNDGSPAVLYVRGWTDEALKDVWEIHLQGGGSCASWTSCAVRWCGAAYYDASKMSSNWTPEEIGAVGVMDSGPGNLLSGANHAYFYYCSSDAWAGMGTMSLSAPDPEDTGNVVDTGSIELPDLPDYTMLRHGHTIVEAAIDELEAGVVSDLGEAMPPLGDADFVLFNGTSGGASGARSHADWLTDRLGANGTTVLAVFDAANTPRTEDWPESLQADLEERNILAWDTTLASSDVPPFVDESCAAIYGSGDEAWRCFTGTWVLYNHITTPFFVRQDLRDIGEVGELLAISVDEHEVAVASSMAALAQVPEDAVEATGMTVTPGAYAPNCGQHVAMETDDWWRIATVESDDGVPMTFQDAVFAWYQGERVAVIDEPVMGEGDGPRSVCSEVY